MDARIEERLKRWHHSIEETREAEEICLKLEASEKSLFSELFLKAPGKTIAEREAIVYASEDWRNFAMGLAEARSAYNHQRRLLEVKQAAYQGDYLQAKHEHEAVKRHP